MAGPPAHLITPSLTTPLPEAEFSAVYAEAAEGGSSSGGELSDIAAQYEESQAGSLTPARPISVFSHAALLAQEAERSAVQQNN